MNDFSVSFASARAVIIVAGRLLITRLPQANFCFLPGGRPEAGETLEICLNRELQEELGAQSWAIGSYLGFIDHTWVTTTGKSRSMQHFYAVSAPEMEPTITPTPCLLDGIEFEWITLEHTKELKLQPPSLPSLILAWHKDGAANWATIDTEDS